MTVKRKPKLKRRWYTVAYLTREGASHMAYRPGNFSHIYKDEKMLLEDAVYAMTHEIAHRGAYVYAVWPGEISQQEALHGATKPVFYVFQGGTIERL